MDIQRKAGFACRVGLLAAVVAASGCGYAPKAADPSVAGTGKIVGYMLDVSRFRVPTMETVKRQVDILAELGYNHFQLYTEHTFAYPGHEDVWREASPFTPAEIRELDAYCADRGIELVPNQNSFGHLEHWLRHPAYNRLAEAPQGGTTCNGWVCARPASLCPTDPASVAFVAGLYDALFPCFRSKYVNVGGDETMELLDDGKVRVGRSAAEIRAKKLDEAEKAIKAADEAAAAENERGKLDAEKGAKEEAK